MLEYRSVARSIPLCISMVKAAVPPPLVPFGAKGVLAQVSDGGGVDRRGDGRARLRHQIPERFAVEVTRICETEVLFFLADRLPAESTC